ncbi:hypothetical protein M2E15_4495 [Bacillus mycoides]|nr:hypothetical protein M2E15_4495 [Bacillus mycoides]
MKFLLSSLSFPHNISNYVYTIAVTSSYISLLVGPNFFCTTSS